MKELLRKAFSISKRRRVKKMDSWQKGFFDSLAEGYELNMLDQVTSGEQM